MNLPKLIPLIACLLVGCSSAPKQADKPTPVTARPSTTDAQAVEAERQRERQIPCSAEWLKTATEAQRKGCLNQSSINQAMNALSTRPSSTTKKPPNTSTTKQ
jgi:hypothetical protein